MEALLTHPIVWATGLVLLGQLVVYLGVFRKLAAHRPDCTPQGTLPPLSVIIAAQNEEENLLNNLPAILKQDYPNYEVIVVDDQSYDDSPLVLEGLTERYPHLRVVEIGEHIHEFRGKKLALTLGIKAARHDLLVFTDADCHPLTDQWLKLMAGAYGKETQMVIGYSPYARYSGLLNLLIRYDTVYTALQYFSFALLGNAYMGVGRNLSYRKSFFMKNKGFASVLSIPSGDDDLLVNRLAHRHNVEVQLCPESFVISKPKRNWNSWLRQKRRHQLAGRLYKSKHKWALGMIWLSHLLFYYIIAIGFLLPDVWMASAAALGLRLLIQYIIVYLTARRLQEGWLWLWAPFLDIFYQIIFLPLFSLSASRRRKKKLAWN